MSAPPKQLQTGRCRQERRLADTIPFCTESLLELSETVRPIRQIPFLSSCGTLFWNISVGPSPTLSFRHHLLPALRDSKNKRLDRRNVDKVSSLNEATSSVPITLAAKIQTSCPFIPSTVSVVESVPYNRVSLQSDVVVLNPSGIASHGLKVWVCCHRSATDKSCQLLISGQ